MKSSGHNQPCPVCSRVKDADCRFNDEVVLCHTGTDLRPGDTITISVVDGSHAAINHSEGSTGLWRGKVLVMASVVLALASEMSAKHGEDNLVILSVVLPLKRVLFLPLLNLGVAAIVSSFQNRVVVLTQIDLGGSLRVLVSDSGSLADQSQCSKSNKLH